MPRFNPREYSENKKEVTKFRIPRAGDEVVLSCMRDGTKFTKSSKGGELLVLKLEVEEGYEGAGYWIFWSIPLENEYTSSFAGQVMEAMGIDVSKPRELEPKLFFGRRCRAMIKHETYGGKTRAKVNYFTDMGEDERNEPPRLKPRPSGSTSEPPSAAAGNEEIPF